MVVPWATIAPDPTAIKRPSFDATDPNAYAAERWAPYDAIIRRAQQDGLGVDLTCRVGFRVAHRSCSATGSAHTVKIQLNGTTLRTVTLTAPGSSSPKRLTS